MSLQFCSIASGSNGNCHYIQSKEGRILIDAGLSGKRIQERLLAVHANPNKIEGIFVTHEHIDHIKGVGILSRRWDIPIYANEGTWEGMKGSIGKIKPEHIKVIKTNESFVLKDLVIHPFSVYHDAIDPVGYCIETADAKLSIVTDTGKICDEIKYHIQDSNFVLIESNHDIDMVKTGRYPWSLKKRILSELGHLSNIVCGETIVDLFQGKQMTFLLGHLSGENNTIDLAMDTVKQIVQNRGIMIGKDLHIHMTSRDTHTAMFQIQKLA